MIADLRQDHFTHCRCLNCKHFGRIDTFNPRVVDAEDGNNPYIKITVDDGSNGMIQVMNFNCPICNSGNVESLYASEVN